MSKRTDGDIITVTDLADRLSYKVSTMSRILGVPESAKLRMEDVAAFLAHPETGSQRAREFLEHLIARNDLAISTAALAKNLRLSPKHVITKYRPDLVVSEGPDRQVFAWSFNRFKEEWEKRPKLTAVEDGTEKGR